MIFQTKLSLVASESMRSSRPRCFAIFFSSDIILVEVFGDAFL